MWVKVLELASRVNHPISAAVFALVIGCSALVRLRSRRPLVAWLLFAIVVILGLAPLAASTFVKTQGVYHMRIIVLLPDGQPTDEAELSSSIGGEIKKANKNWEYDLPPQTKPSNETVTLFASIPSAYLQGHTDFRLGENFYPTISIQVVPFPSVQIRGVVVDQNNRSIPKAKVSEIGYGTITKTDEMGNFSILSHGAAGQLVQLRAEKGSLSAQVSAIAGGNVQIVLR